MERGAVEGDGAAVYRVAAAFRKAGEDFRHVVDADVGGGFHRFRLGHGDGGLRRLRLLAGLGGGGDLDGYLARLGDGQDIPFEGGARGIILDLAAVRDRPLGVRRAFVSRRIDGLPHDLPGGAGRVHRDDDGVCARKLQVIQRAGAQFGDGDKAGGGMPAVIGGDGDGGGAQGDACDITVGGHRGDALVAALPADGFIRRAVGLHRGGEELRPGSFDAHGGFV